MPPANHISTGMENFTAVGLEKFNLTDQESHIKNVSNIVEFQQESSITTGTLLIRPSCSRIPFTGSKQNESVCVIHMLFLISSKRFLVSDL